MLLKMQQIVFAQSKAASYRLLQVGDDLPDYTLNNLINYQTKSARLSDFKGKLVILDFWSTTCASCVQSWPKLLSLQKQFGDQLQIILVNGRQNESIIRKSIAKRKALANVTMDLPVVCGDTILSEKLFKHTGDPHLVWVSPQGKVLSITGGNEANAENIEAVLTKGDVGMRQKVEMLDVNFARPLFVDGNGGDGRNLLWSSFVSGYAPGVISTAAIIPRGKISKVIVVSNSSIEDIYAFAYSRSTDIYGNVRADAISRVRIQAKDTTKYVGRLNGIYQHKNYYTYQMVGQPTERGKLLEMMQQDLKKYFGMQVSRQMLKVPCLVFTMKDSSLVSYKAGEKKFWVSDTNFKLNDVTLSDLIKEMETATGYYWSAYPIVDATGFKGKLGGIDIETDVDDRVALDKALKAYGISLEIQSREVEMLVLKEPGL